MSANVELGLAREELERALWHGTPEQIDAAEARIDAALEKRAEERLQGQRDRIVEILVPWCRSKDHARLAAEELVADGFRNWQMPEAFVNAIMRADEE